MNSKSDPSAESAVADESVHDESVADEAVHDESVHDESVHDESVADESVADESVADESAHDEAVDDEAVRQQRERHQLALNRLFARIGEVSSLPTVAMRVIDVAGDQSACSDDLLRVVESDPALATRILRTVNSSQFGRRHQVQNLKDAITLLGFKEIRNLALTVYVARQFQDSGTYRGYSRQGLWSHMVAVGTAARMVTQICGRVNPDEAYLAGLLHDVGLILIDQSLHRHFCAVLDQVTADVDTTAVERNILTFDHAQLGHFVARQWNFPEQIGDAIGFHHRPEEYTGPHRELVYAVSIANYLVSRNECSSLGIHNLATPAVEVLNGLGIKNEQFTEICDRLPEVLDNARIIANV